MGAPIAIGPLLTQGLKNEFTYAYEPLYKGVEAEIGDVIWWNATSDKISELYGGYDSPLHPVRWDPGNMIASKTILSKQYRVTNRDFGRRVYLPRNADDDQTGGAENIARGLGRNWAMLPERIFYQYIQAGTDNDLLPAVPNSADGSALYSTSTRYGSSGGNGISQTGSWSSVQSVITDCFAFLRRFAEFQDTEGQPYWDTATLRANGIKIFVGTSLTLPVQQAEKQMLTFHLNSGTDTTHTDTAAATNNTIMASGVPFRFVVSQRITDSKAYAFLPGLPVERRAIVRQIRQAMQESIGNYETSDHARDTGETYIQYRSREGWGSWLAIATVRAA